MPDEDDLILRTWLEWEIEGRTRRVILVVETAVEMSPEDPLFDSAMLDRLRQSALNRMRANPSAIDLLRIVPPR